MGKKKLLLRISELEEVIKDYQEMEDKHMALSNVQKALHKENEALKKEIGTLQDKIKKMSDTESLYNELLKYQEARTCIAINHNNVLDALNRVKTQHKKMMSEFTPYIEQFKQNIHDLTDEFLIPIDNATNKVFLSGKEERVRAYEARSVNFSNSPTL